MVFKIPRTNREASQRISQRDTLAKAAAVLDECRVEPDMAGRLRDIALQMDTAIRGYRDSQS